MTSKPIKGPGLPKHPSKGYASPGKPTPPPVPSRSPSSMMKKKVGPPGGYGKVSLPGSSMGGAPRPKAGPGGGKVIRPPKTR